MSIPHLGVPVLAKQPNLVAFGAAKRAFSFPEFHAHVYYAPEQRDMAVGMREQMGDLFEGEMGELHDDPPRGPHLMPEFDFTFTNRWFSRVVQWLMQHSQGLSVLIHPVTDESDPVQERLDHTERTLWIGDSTGRIDASFFDETA